MNREDQYEVNRGNWEYPAWALAHWVRAADCPNFHYMKMDDGGSIVLKHRSVIRSLKPNTIELEVAMQNLITHKDLTPDAKKLLETAIEAQATGKRPVLDFWI